MPAALELTDEERRRAQAAGLDPDNTFVRHAMANGYCPEPRQAAADPELVRGFCPIESGVPFPAALPDLPADYDRRPRFEAGPIGVVDTKYPFPFMAVGDCFIIHHALSVYAVKAAAQYYADTHRPVAFSFRRGRCWRVR